MRAFPKWTLTTSLVIAMTLGACGKKEESPAPAPEAAPSAAQTAPPAPAPEAAAPAPAPAAAGARLTFATNAVPDWNEVDAVQLLGD